MDFDRRQLMVGLGALAAGSAVAALASTSREESNERNERFQQNGGDFSWTPHKLDPAECARVAYDGYWHKGYACGYGAFYSIIGVMGEKFGRPYSTFPFSMLEANKSGVCDWGTICGALYGAAASFALFWGREERKPLVDELFRWYETTKLPIYDPGAQATGYKGHLPATAVGSILCHISVSKWCYANKFEATSTERSERCGRITADVAFKAVVILNAKIDAGKKFSGSLPAQDSLTACGACHSTPGEETNWSKTRMDCTPCHSGSPAVQNKFENHP